MGRPKLKIYCNIPGPEGPCAKLICEAPPMTVPRIGEEPDKNSQAIITAINDHLMKRHGIQLFGIWKQFLGYLSLGMIRSEDPAANDFLAIFAKHLCDISCIRISDDQILQRVADMGFTAEDPQRQKVIDAMREIRDWTSRRMAIPEVSQLVSR